MMKDAFQFMQALTKRIPPLRGHAHQLIIRDGKLQLNLLNATPCWQFIFSSADLEKDPILLVSEVVRMLPPKDNGPKPSKPAA